MRFDELKLIALKLASLHKSDLDWVLNQLDQETKDKLLPLINEIHDVGLDLDQMGLVFDENNLFNKRDSNEKLFSTVIDQTKYEDILEVFKGEHPFFLERLTSLYSWSWNRESNSKAQGNSKKSKNLIYTNQQPLLAKAILNTTEKILLEKNNNIDVSFSEGSEQGFLASILQNIPFLRKLA